MDWPVTRIDQDQRQGEFTATTPRPAILHWGNVFVVNMNSKFTVECVFSIVEGHAIFRGIAHSWSRINENSWPFYLFRLVGMQHRHGIEGAIEGPGLLPSHQGHKSGCWRRQPYRQRQQQPCGASADDTNKTRQTRGWACDGFRRNHHAITGHTQTLESSHPVKG